MPLPRRYDVALTSGAGYPLALTYYQTIKGMVGARAAVRPGGKLFIASACDEGLGSEAFRQAQRRLLRTGGDGFLKELLAEPLAPADAWQTEMLLKVQRHAAVHLLARGLSEEDWRDTGVARVRDLEAELSAAVTATADRALIVIPEGPYVIPAVPQPAAP